MADGAPELDLPALRRDLLAWYDECGRRLPWRESTDPYRVLVSEALLQQVQVAQATGHFRRLLEAFPTVEDLAAATPERVMHAWQGMGLYARAHRLHEAARLVARDGMPDDVEGLRRLPGVGPYVAAAVASIAFGRPEAAVEGNIRRVLARLFLEPEPRPRRLRELAGLALEPGRAGDWNQALMDLGATVCVPGRPRCGRCPLAGHCRARAAGRELEVPSPARRAPGREVRAVVLAAGTGGRFLLERRGGAWLRGTQGFPLEEVAPGQDGAAFSRLLDRLGAAGRCRSVGTIKHTSSGRSTEARVFALELDRPDLARPEDAALSALDRKVLALLGRAA